MTGFRMFQHVLVWGSRKQWLFLNNERGDQSMRKICEHNLIEMIKSKFAGWKKSYLVFTAVCLLVLLLWGIITAYHLFAALRNPGIDPYRVGKELKVFDISDISGYFNGNLLAEKLDFESAERSTIDLYYDENGAAENVSDWYSLMIFADYTDYEMTMYCFFDGEKTVEDRKVRAVFTKDATETVEINGTTVSVAHYNLGIDYKYTYYSIFEFQNVIYDVRVNSDNTDRIYDILNDILSD